MDFQLPERLELANIPTPVRRMDSLSQRLGKEVYVKRDDLTGCATSGNKIRKLEFVLAEALSREVDVVITVGSLQSNHCRATAFACRKVGLQPHLILRGEKPGKATGNLLLDRLCEARVTVISPDDYYQRLDEVVQEVVEEHEAEGRDCLYVPTGASTPLGAMGYVLASKEIAQWQEESGVEADRIYHAAGSGGTSAGLTIGTRLYGVKGRVRGINVGEPQREFVEFIEKLVREAIEDHEVPVSYEDCSLEIVDGYYGEGYGDITPEALDTIRLLARSEGIVLDPVYSAKGMYGMMEEESRIDGGTILFIHTGGIFSLFGLYTGRS